jgi:hypothetical protein
MTHQHRQMCRPRENSIARYCNLSCNSKIVLRKKKDYNRIAIVVQFAIVIAIVVQFAIVNAIVVQFAIDIAIVITIFTI